MPNSPRGNHPTIRTIATLAGVSHQTVSNVLNFPERVALATQDKVRAAIAELNYQPSETARSLARAESRMIAVHTGDGKENEASILDPYTRELARIGNRLGYRLVLYYSPSEYEAEINSYRDLQARRAVDGIVISNTRIGDPRPDWLLAHRMPFVAFGRPWKGADLQHSWVDVDGHLGSRLAVEHLRELGHRRIGYLSAPLTGSIMNDRRDGWLDAMTHSEPAEVADWYREVELPDVPGAVAHLVAAGVTAIVCRDDIYAMAAMRALDLAGLRPGREVAVIGYDDSEIARHAHPRLSTIRQPITQIAEFTWHALLSQLAGLDAAPVQEIISPELVIRESSGGVVG